MQQRWFQAPELLVMVCVALAAKPSFATAPHDEVHDDVRRKLSRKFNDSIVCKLVIEDIMLANTSNNGTTSGAELERIRCIALNTTNGMLSESDELFPFQHVPEKWERRIKAKLSLHDYVLAELPGARFNKNQRILLRHHHVTPQQVLHRQIAPTPIIRFLTDADIPDHVRRRHLLEMQRPKLGVREMTVCRISTKDSEPRFSTDELYAGIFGSMNKDDNEAPNFHNQFSACSFGQLQWVPSEHGVIDVKLPKRTKFYENDPFTMMTAAHGIIKERFGLENVRDLSDRVLMCLPPETGTWAASAAIGHWRAQFNDEWCLSLGGLMHEVGHTLGLRHANQDGVAYADATGYMSSGSPIAQWPQKCFNGYKNWKLGFYKARHLTIRPLQRKHSGMVKFMLATFVDYPRTTRKQPVVVNIDDYLFLQYNRAKEFNRDTGAHLNRLVITEGFEDKSDSRGGLGVGQEFVLENYQSSGRDLVIRVCRQVTSPEQNRNSLKGSDAADYMEVVVGVDRADCSIELSPDIMTGRAEVIMPTMDRGKSSRVPSSPAAETGGYRYRQRRQNTGN